MAHIVHPAFPPRTQQQDEVDIQDPWRGPRVFAEDFYSGGDVPATALEGGDPHILPGEEDTEGAFPVIRTVMI